MALGLGHVRQAFNDGGKINTNKSNRQCFPGCFIVDSYLNFTFSLGNGFVDSPQLHCLYGSGETELKATFVSSAEIRCELPSQHTQTPQTNKLSLMFSRSDDNTKKFSIDHHMGLDVPTVVSAQFSDQLNVIRVTFSGIVALAGNYRDYRNLRNNSFCKHVS